MATGHQSGNGRSESGQSAIWNGIAGQTWVDLQQLLDGMFQPFENMLVQSIPRGADRRVLDIGCGTGSTSLAMSRQLGTNGQCTGIDISQPMIHLARERAQQAGLNTAFICGDAQTHGFKQEFDLIVSRFGVMFFDDLIAAFANLQRAARDDAQLRLIAWRSPEENPFMTTGERASRPLLPDLPTRKPDEPGQFAFASQDRVHGILDASGWSSICIEPIDVACTFPEKGLLPYLTRMGTLGRVLQGVEESTRRHVIETVRAAFDPYVHGEVVRFTAACWDISAKA